MSQSNLPLGAEFEESAPWNSKEEEFECYECGVQMNSDKQYCSTKCFNSSNR